MTAASTGRDRTRMMVVGRIGRDEGGPLFERQFTDKLQDAFVDNITFDVDPKALRIKANA